MFKNTGGTWIEQAKLIASDRASGDIFGDVVAVGSHRIVVGAPFNDDPADLSGSVYVFTPDGGSGFVETKLRPSDSAQDQQFGTSVATADNRIVVGARGDQMAGFAAGAAYIFRLEGTGWIEEMKLISQDIQPFDIFGVSVAINDERVAVGALGAQTDGVRVGAVYVFRRDNAGWIEEAKLVASDPHELDFLGHSVGMTPDGKRIIAGADGNEAAYIFRRSGTSWVQETKLVAGDGSFGLFGTSVAIRDPYAAVGSPQDNEGTTYLFRFDGANWNLLSKIKASDAFPADEFGLSVALDDRHLMVGAPLHPNEFGPGAAYVYDPTLCDGEFK